ncbi:MAG TPA: bacterial transcriptional activator domain-containing protein, partial [Candidatus Baltobacteraceae bacterium]|nr:bacterial transcriptional activator domain-containing protein [Candidatus Baltobacteraceae bacterium]
RAAVVALAEDALQRRDTEEAIRYANHLREQDPCDERARSITIRAHIATGNKSEAVREYRDYRRAVRNELGIEIFPEAEIEETLRAFVSPIER